MIWQGVFAATTTPFLEDLSVDHDALRAHVRWLIAEGCRGIVPLGSLGESSTLTAAEKRAILATCVGAARSSNIPVVAGISGTSTVDAVELAGVAQAEGCDGLMVLPPYIYRGDVRETEGYYDTVLRATSLSCMLYNNPIAYGTDVLPDRIAALAARHPNLHAVKESSGDIRRMTAIRALSGELALFCGIDDVIIESVDAGAVGWIAGLVNALPRESVDLFELASGGPPKRAEARALYERFLPLLRLDALPKFVQLIKLVQAELSRGSARVRPPRLELAGDELAAYKALLVEHLGAMAPG